MTSPAPQYYENIIARDPKLQAQYLQHIWPRFRSVRKIRSFTFERSMNIYSYSKGRLTFRKSPPNPSWAPPAEYLREVEIPLTAAQEASIRRALAEANFPFLRSSPCAFVNFAGGYLVSEHFHCRFSMGKEYHFASEMAEPRLDALERTLDTIAGTSAQCRRLDQLEKEIFDFKRWERLNGTTQTLK